MLPTPTYKHLAKSPLKQLVYEPAEDTFLFLDALEFELAFIRSLAPLTVLELGSGSGVVITFLANNLNLSANFFAVDVNKNACAATKETACENRVAAGGLNVIQADLLHAFKEHSVDLLLFNAPYVPSEEHEIVASSLSAAWAGGCDGRQVMDRLFPLIPKVLTENGVFYLVCIKPNKIDEIEALFLEEFNFEMKIVLNRRTSIENLFVLKFYRKK